MPACTASATSTSATMSASAASGNDECLDDTGRDHRKRAATGEGVDANTARFCDGSAGEVGHATSSTPPGLA